MRRLCKEGGSGSILIGVMFFFPPVVQVSAGMWLPSPAHDGVLGPRGIQGGHHGDGDHHGGHHRGLHSRDKRDLMDDDLLTPVLSMFSGGPRSRCCKQLTLCDLATTLLQAVEANKAQDVETLRRRKAQPGQPDQHAWRPFQVSLTSPGSHY